MAAIPSKDKTQTLGLPGDGLEGNEGTGLAALAGLSQTQEPPSLACRKEQFKAAGGLATPGEGHRTVGRERQTRR